jgi:polyhydroxyalkanoate synthesis regulator phasin
VESQIKDPKDYYKQLSVFWTDLIYLMSSKPHALSSVGPMRNFAANAKKISTELVEASDNLTEFNKSLSEYYRQLSETWKESQKKVTLKFPKIPKDFDQLEEYKKIWIDVFESDFTQLFDSKMFGKNYGKLVSNELELTKRWNNIMDVMLKSANLPNKQEIDQVYKELHTLRKRVTKLESKQTSIEPKENEN